MIEIERARTIARPPEAVWDALADFGALSSWAPRIDHSSLLGAESEPLGPGVVRRVQTGRTTLLESIVDCEAPALLSYDISGLPPIVRAARNTWRLTAEGGGRTRATLASTVDCGPRPPQQLMARLVGRRMAKESDSMLAGLAHSLRRRPPCLIVPTSWSS